MCKLFFGLISIFLCNAVVAGGDWVGNGMSHNALFLSSKKRQELNKKFEKETAHLAAVSRGGDWVGNGGGVAETNFYYVFNFIGETIADCFANPICSLDSRDEAVLTEILKAYDRNKTLEDPILFLKKKNANGFFRTKEDKEERIAKTGFSPMHPTFINVDKVYQSQFTKTDYASDLQLILQMLIHELGHKAGVVSHSYLDRLGGKLRLFMQNKANFIELRSHNEKFYLNVQSFDSVSLSSKVLFTYANGRSVEMTDKIMRGLQCIGKDRSPLSFNLSNLAWKRAKFTGKGKIVIGFTGWLEIYCESDLVVIDSDYADLEYSLTFQNVNGNFHLVKESLKVSNQE